MIDETANPTIDLLLARRSLVASKLIDPGPSVEELETILRCATRVPDHGKLNPWRIQVVQGDARRALGEVWGDIFKRNNPKALPEGLLGSERDPPSPGGFC